MGTSDELPFEMAEGFHVTTAAGDELVHDCFCMTTDGLGRPVVSGPGYIKTLIDDNQDGIYDRAIVWSTIPQQVRKVYGLRGGKSCGLEMVGFGPPKTRMATS